MLDLTNKWVLVTGASRGLGRLMTEELARRGANLILQASKEENLGSIAEFCRNLGREVVTVGCDLGSIEEVNAMLDKIDSYDIDVVYNNAGKQVTYRPNVFDTDPYEYDISFRINTVAPMMICYRILPKMLKKGFGRILNTTSGIDNEPEQGPYSASKAGLDKVTKDLCKLVKDEDVRIFLTDPGWCRTDLGGPMAPNDPISAVPGLLAGGFASNAKNGSYLHAQDYAHLTLEEIVKGVEDGKYPL